MNTQRTPIVLDLLSRKSARERGLVSGSSVWYREDVRLDDGASRVLPAVFQKYRGEKCSVVIGRTDDGSGRAVWVSVDDVFPRHWADDVQDDRPRIAWAPPPIVPLDAGPTSVLVVLVSLVVVLGLLFVVFRVWGLP